ncbi:MAG: cysteine--tRNA ligase [Bacteroidetes bacterium]|nr:cysteine--tRNA ligase [Bacteroidota bacterium]
MEHHLKVYNTLSRKKEIFAPNNPPFVGMYVCGPTVYGDAHLGHARPAINFDLVFRYLMHLGYKVRYVRNITDVGHLEGDADEGEDKIGKKARLEKIEPMEIVQHYTNQYHKLMDRLNVLRPSIEPHASGHIIEQIEMIRKIQDAGFAYEKNGSIYFDIEAYNKKHPYGILSGRKIDELFAYTRELEGQEEKKNSFDFALWKKATPEHLMHWPSPWSEGYPGWHLECSTMGTKYLGDHFDIHGGGLDLQFPHHECEIAQSIAANDKMPVKYWLHNNMITINGQKMGKSLGNAVSLEQFFSGNHDLLDQAYSPMTIRFFILQAHYRSPLDFSNEALQAAEKGLKKLLTAMDSLEKLKSGNKSDSNISELTSKCYAAMDDDFNTPILIAHLFEGVRIINSVKDKKETITANDLKGLKTLMSDFVFEILGLKSEDSGENSQLVEQLMGTILQIRQNARENKDWPTSDLIRDQLAGINIVVKDTNDGPEWGFKE